MAGKKIEFKVTLERAENRQATGLTAPKRVVEFFATRGRVPVRGTINGCVSFIGDANEWLSHDGCEQVHARGRRRERRRHCERRDGERPGGAHGGLAAAVEENAGEAEESASQLGQAGLHAQERNGQVDHRSEAGRDARAPHSEGRRRVEDGHEMDGLKRAETVNHIGDGVLLKQADGGDSGSAGSETQRSIVEGDAAESQDWN